MSSFVRSSALLSDASIPWWGVLASIAALVISAGALGSSHVFQRRAALARLLDRFEAAHLHVRLWRIEQVTRLPRVESSDVTRRTISEIIRSLGGNEDQRTTVADALAMNWKSERFDMQEMYFFALQVRAWMPPTDWLAKRSARQLNRAFGYQLLSAFLDQRITACRLLPNPGQVGIPPGAAIAYYPTHYGLFDKAYNDVVNWLADDLLKNQRDLPGRIRQVLATKRSNIDGLLANLAPQAASTTGQPPALEDMPNDQQR